MHYERARKGRDLGPAEPLRRASGEGHLNKQGYVMRRINGRDIAEHRYVMEQLLGRELASHENVHHVNGIRNDNRTNGPLRGYRSGNLELWSSWQPCAQRVVDKVQFAIEILERYLPEALSAQPPLTLLLGEQHEPA
ncbi:MAG: hypothetical protein QOI82_3132 [Actinomycetota bacterium]|jgi:hypothetical protein|nr:hypothetical protein [Actinomycetota bacterium]